MDKRSNEDWEAYRERRLKFKPELISGEGEFKIIYDMGYLQALKDAREDFLVVRGNPICRLARWLARAVMPQKLLEIQDRPI
jgi:hypothetical protein